MLTNGARYYVDHAHPEYSTPECSTVREIVLYDKAGELILARSVEAAGRLLPSGQRVVVLGHPAPGAGRGAGEPGTPPQSADHPVLRLPRKHARSATGDP